MGALFRLLDILAATRPYSQVAVGAFCFYGPLLKKGESMSVKICITILIIIAFAAIPDERFAIFLAAFGMLCTYMAGVQDGSKERKVLEDNRAARLALLKG